MRKFLIVLTWLAIAGGAFATLAGLLAPWLPQVELINHFRPYLLAAAAGAFAFALVLRRRWLLAASAVYLAGSAVLFAAPFASAMAGADAPGTTLRVLTANVWAHNQQNDEIVRFLSSSNADVVLLQEIGGPKMSALASLLPAYPHVYCPDPACELGILSKRPWIAAGKQDLGNRHPLLVWARFLEDGFTYEVIGLHVAWPFHPKAQARHIDWLIEHVRSRGVPLIVAGDFNLTPFSWKLAKFAHQTGLRRAMTIGASWPAHRLVPVVLLDHVFASPEFRLGNARLGPRLGSDHLPVVADLVRPSPSPPAP